MSEDILYEAHGHVRLITINRPARMNSLDFAANQRLVEAFARFAGEEEARVAVITGAGEAAFCAGADLKTYTMAFATAPAPAFRERYTDGHGLGGITRGLVLNKPVIAAVNGYAMSGGLEIALAADLRFCSPNAAFAFQDVKWGFHPCDGGCVRLPMIVGLGNAMELILSGERIGAEHALRIGLVNRVYPLAELRARALDYAALLARRAPLAQRFAKDVMLRSFGLSLDEALRLESRSFRDLAHTEDLAEGTAAFRERREAEFKGR
jgi:enoyl-CoA hydratase/carnithine racemase